MKTTCIYGLYDPRSPDVIMYVGKGGEKRAQFHWKRFLSKGTAVNSLLRKWFEKLKSENVTSTWRFLEENVVNWQECEKDQIEKWRLINSGLCNIADGGNQLSLDASYSGGKAHKGWSPSLEQRQHHSQLLRGRTLTLEHRNKISQAMKGIVRSAEHNRKLGESRRGRVGYWRGKTRPLSFCEKIGDAHRGKKLSEETRKKISTAKRGKPSSRRGVKLTDDHRKKLSIAHLGQVPWNKGERVVRDG